MTSSDSPSGVGAPAWGELSSAPGSTGSYSHAGSTAGTGVSADAPTATVPAVPAQPAHGGGAHATPTSAHANPTAARTRPAGRARGPRRANLQLRHVNPWTVLKFSCVLAIALFFVWLIVVGVLFGVLDAAGVIGKINDAYTTLKGGGANPPVTAGLVFGSAAIIGVVNIILFIALSTIGSVIYNLCADLVGGIEVTLSER